MRNRFFFIILATLIISAIGITFVHVYFFKSQRLNLIDMQIAESSTTLLQSVEFNQSVNSLATVDDTISQVLKEGRIGKVFVIRDLKDRILYQSFNVGLLNANLPTHPEWVTVETDTQFVKIRNAEIHQTDLVLQVGLVLDRNFLNWEIVDDRVVRYVTGFVFSLFVFSILVTLILLSPLRLLIGHLKEATSNLINLKDVKPLPNLLTRYAQGFWSKSDEFSELLNATQKLIDRINSNHKLTRSWTLQMAHELKTPLAIIRMETESLSKGTLPTDKYSQSILQEIHQMSDIISQFLDWAELENSQFQKEIHALRIKTVVKAVAARLNKIRPDRIRIHADADFSIFANPGHLDQLVTNLVTNALKFSPESENIEIILSNHSLTVKDYGPGIPKEVKERIGQPFNVGSHEVNGLTGNGLGLAWVSTVAKLYQWNFEIHSSPTGTEAVIWFPKEEV